MTSQLEAINYVLLAIKESPINSLNSPFPEEASQALERITLISREMQNRGWWFNRETDKTLPLNASNQIELGSDVLAIRFNAWVKQRPFPVPRGTLLFNTDTNSYTFDAPIEKVTIIRELNWDALPEVARRYVMKKAARQMAAVFLGSSQATQAAAYDESEEWAQLLEEDQRYSQHNMFDNPELYDMTLRWSS